MQLLKTHLSFWKEAPLLLISLTFASGSFASLSSLFYPLFILLFLILSSRKWLLILIFLFGFFYTSFFHNLPTKKESGKALFSLSSISKTSNYKNGFVYRGTLTYLKTKAHTYRNIPLSIFVSKNRPRGNKNYYVEGTLKIKKGFYSFKPTSWREKRNSFSFAEIRFHLKENFQNYLEKNFKSPVAQKFFFAFIAGELDDNYLKFAFQQTGLSHVLVISGLNFSIIVCLLSKLLFFLKNPFREWFFLIFLTLYYFFVGSAPSIDRAFISIIITLLGIIFSKKSYPLNSMGAALLVQTLLMPYNLLNIGLELSYLCSASIILLATTFEKFFFFLKKRNHEELKLFSLLDIHGYIIAQFIKKSLALTLAVNFATIPLILFTFHKFAISSFLYNLFFPQCTTLSLLLFLIAFFLPPFTFLLNYLNNLFTNLILLFVLYPPSFLIEYIRIKTIEPFFIIFYLLLFFSFAIPLYLKEKDRLPDLFRFI